MAKHPGGRPTEYKPGHCELLIEFFAVPKYRQVCVKRTEKALRKGFEKPEVVEEFIEKGGDLPFFSEFARSIGVIPNTLLVWCEKHEEFKVAYNVAKEMQKNHLVQNGIQGNYNAAFGIFTAKNITEMRDQSEVKHSGSIDITSKTMMEAVNAAEVRASNGLAVLNKN